MSPSSDVKLIDLYRMGSRWYAKYQRGNVTSSGPTIYPSSTAMLEVLQAISNRNPGIEILVPVKSQGQTAEQVIGLKEFKS